MPGSYRGDAGTGEFSWHAQRDTLSTPIFLYSFLFNLRALQGAPYHFSPLLFAWGVSLPRPPRRQVMTIILSHCAAAWHRSPRICSIE